MLSLFALHRQNSGAAAQGARGAARPAAAQAHGGRERERRARAAAHAAPDLFALLPDDVLESVLLLALDPACDAASLARLLAVCSRWRALLSSCSAPLALRADVRAPPPPAVRWLADRSAAGLLGGVASLDVRVEWESPAAQVRPPSGLPTAPPPLNARAGAGPHAQESAVDLLAAVAPQPQLRAVRVALEPNERRPNAAPAALPSSAAAQRLLLRALSALAPASALERLEIDSPAARPPQAPTRPDRDLPPAPGRRWAALFSPLASSLASLSLPPLLPLHAEQCGALAAALPRLRSLSLALAGDDDSALEPLAPLAALEELTLHGPPDLYFGPGLAALSAGPAGRSIRRVARGAEAHELWCGPVGVEALSAMHGLRSLSIEARALVHLWDTEEDAAAAGGAERTRGAALLRGLAAAVGRLPALNSLHVAFYLPDERGLVSGPAAATLARAGSRALRWWSYVQHAARPLSVDEAAALASCPHLEYVAVGNVVRREEDLRGYALLRGVRLRCPAARLELYVRAPPALEPHASAVLRRWLPGARVRVRYIAGGGGPPGGAAQAAAAAEE
eukprot:tig00021435_g21437.t1